MHIGLFVEEGMPLFHLVHGSESEGPPLAEHGSLLPSTASAPPPWHHLSPSSHCELVPTFQPGPSKLTPKAARSVSTSRTVRSSSESENPSIAACKTVWGCSSMPGPGKNSHNLLELLVMGFGLSLRMQVF